MMRVSSAFTLVELMVVISIIVLLLALLTPALDAAIERAVRIGCAVRLHGQGVALVMYAQDNRRIYAPPAQAGNWPDGGMAADDGGPAGQVRLYVTGHMGDRRLAYCPAKGGWATEDNGAWNSSNPSNSVVAYPYWARFRSPYDSNPLPDLVADKLTSPGDRVAVTDTITFETGLLFKAEGGSVDASRNHRGDGRDGRIDGQAIENPPAGGNALTNDQAVAWRDFGLTRLRVTVPPGIPAGMGQDRQFWF